MIRNFIYENKQYQYFNFNEIEKTDLVYFPKIKKNKKLKYINLSVAFDIETYTDQDKHLATMYIWQVAIGGKICVCGRTWDDFISFLELIKKLYDPSEKQKILVWVHNLSYEFQFIKKLIPWEINKKTGYAKIFALDSRKVVKAVSEYYEFRDSLVLTNLSLAKLAKDYNFSNQKLKGDLDYSIPRFGGSDPSPLSVQELAYCFNDVLILNEFYDFIFENYLKNSKKLPLTKTGIVRQKVQVHHDKLSKKERIVYDLFINQAFPDFDLYSIMIEWLYRGGYVHTDPALTNDIILYILGSFDFKSAYPAVILQELYPGKFEEFDPAYYERMNNKAITKHEAFMGLFTFYNLESKGKISYESKHKCIEAEDVLEDNGRIWSASKVTVWLTELDFQIYSEVYNYSKVKCHRLLRSEKKELPHFLKDVILEYYYKKETIKDKNSVEYKNAKSDLNSIYGMMVTSLYFMEYHYNIDSGLIESTPSGKDYNMLIEDKILLPQWGIWVTAYVRYRLIHYGFLKCEKDSIYGDTDSCKLKNYLSNLYIFENFNTMIRRINDKMYVGKYDRNIFKNIGIFDFEGKILKFKTLGCKRYLYSTAEGGKIKHHAVVAGMRKGSLERFAEDSNEDIYDLFNEDLYLDVTRSDKLTSIYSDDAYDLEVKDFRGIYKLCHESSGVALINIPFNMNVLDQYLDFISYIKEKNQNRLIKRNYGGFEKNV